MKRWRRTGIAVETANGLAHRDIERYLQDEPVEAGPPSAASIACVSSPSVIEHRRGGRGRLLLATAAAPCKNTWEALLARAAAPLAVASSGQGEQLKRG